MLGTAPNSAVAKYITSKRVPDLFLAVNGDKWGDYRTYPWTMGFAPSSKTEAQIFAKHALNQKPDASFALLYQNDDLGKDFIAGLRAVLGDRYETRVKAVSFEISDPTIDSQIVALRASNADVFISGVTGKFAAQAIRKIYELILDRVALTSPIGTRRPSGIPTVKVGSPGWGRHAPVLAQTAGCDPQP
jgi:branched-chain amino acid transport system substrate-binding protein